MNIKTDKKYLLIIFTSDFYKFYYALNTANTLSACNKKVSIFITGYSCNYILQDWETFDKTDTVAKLKKNNLSSYYEVLSMCMDLGIDFFYCDTALDLLGKKNRKIFDYIDVAPVGLYYIINKFKNDEIIFI